MPPKEASADGTRASADATRASADGTRTPAWLGISMLQTEGGVVVDQLIPGSPAARAGLLPGDRLMRVAGEVVSTPSDVSAVVANHQAGAQVSIDFRRDGAARLLRLETVPKPDTEQLLRHLYVGQPAPSLSSLRTVQGSVVPSLVQLKGSVVVLEFWASWCVACRAMSETLNRWHEDLGVLGVSVLGITMDPYEEAVRATELLELRYPTFSDESGDVTRDYRAMSLPTLFVIDKAGIVREVMVGLHWRRLEEMGAQLKQLALEQPTGASLRGAEGPTLDE